jgi:hypothetical protein
LKPRPEIPPAQEKRCSLEQKSDHGSQNPLNNPKKSLKVPGAGGLFTELQAICQARERIFQKFDKIWFFYHPHTDPNTE